MVAEAAIALKKYVIIIGYGILASPALNTHYKQIMCLPLRLPATFQWTGADPNHRAHCCIKHKSLLQLGSLPKGDHANVFWDAHCNFGPAAMQVPADFL